jgi:NAD(P)-dependent dehydrogenase (short-subunit alcohol dehydrogenase family)
MSTVLIIGASRGIGLETVKLALKAGHSVRAAGLVEGARGDLVYALPFEGGAVSTVVLRNVSTRSLFPESYSAQHLFDNLVGCRQ